MNPRTPFYVGERILLRDGTEVTVLELSPSGSHCLITGGTILYPEDDNFRKNAWMYREETEADRLQWEHLAAIANQ